MKKVILAQTIAMTVLMGCSFSMDPDEPTTISEAQETQLTNQNVFQNLILKGELKELKEAIQSKSHADLNQNFPDGSTPLENGTLRGDIEIIRHLVKFGASPFVANSITKKSLYQDVNSLILEQKKPTSLEVFKYQALQEGISRSKLKIRTLLKNKSFNEILDFVAIDLTPATTIIPEITSSYYDGEIPLATMEKIIKTPSMQGDEFIENLIKKTPSLLLHEIDLQLNKSFPHFALAEFISGKIPNKVHGYHHYSAKEDRSYFVNPSLLLWWRNIRYPALHENFGTHLQKITHFPETLAAVYCSGKCKNIEDAKFSITIDDLSNHESYWGNTILNDSLEAVEADFWNPEEE